MRSSFILPFSYRALMGKSQSVTFWALVLILLAAFIHATWNLLNKQASGHATFTWLVAVASALLYAPLTIGVISCGRSRSALSNSA